jgi:hypothetical protein
LNQTSRARVNGGASVRSRSGELTAVGLAEFNNPDDAGRGATYEWKKKKDRDSGEKKEDGD